jgi:hypothetical protein
MPAQDGLGALLASSSAPHRAECWPLIRSGAVLAKANALTVGERSTSRFNSSESVIIAEGLEAGPATTSPTVPTAAILGVSTGVAALVVRDPHDLRLRDLPIVGRLGWRSFHCGRFGLGRRVWNRGDSERRRGAFAKLPPIFDPTLGFPEAKPIAVTTAKRLAHV